MRNITFLNLLELALSWLEKILAIISGLVLLFMSVSIFYDIVIRNFSSLSAPWVIEISQYGMVYFVFLAAPWILLKRGHVSFDLVVDQLPQKAKRVLFITACIFGAISCFALTIYSFSLVYQYLVRDIWIESIFSVPRWAIFFPIPVGSIILTLEFLRQAFLKVIKT